MGPDENGRLQRDPEVPRGQVHFPSEEVRGVNCWAQGHRGDPPAKEGSRASHAKFGSPCLQNVPALFSLEIKCSKMA